MSTKTRPTMNIALLVALAASAQGKTAGTPNVMSPSETAVKMDCAPCIAFWVEKDHCALVNVRTPPAPHPPALRAPVS